MSKSDGGPAFPEQFACSEGVEIHYGSKVGADPGMSLRDYFAAKAINLFSMDEEAVTLWMSGKQAPIHDYVAKFCYQLADAMLAERAK